MVPCASSNIADLRRLGACITQDRMAPTTPASGRLRAVKKLWPLWVIFLLALSHCAYLYINTGGWVVDDAFVSFRYVENWVDGKGLVFNAGEYVEGYTNFLWVVMLAPLYALGLSTVFSAQIVGVLLSLAAIACLYWIGVDKLGRRLGWLPALLYALNHSLMSWAFGGLAVPLFLFLFLLGTCLLFARGSAWCLPVFALMALTRPEGYFFLALGLLFVWLLNTPERTRDRYLVPTAIAVALCAAHLTFKQAYYGSLLPNTFYAKVGFSLSQLQRGRDYLIYAIVLYVALAPVGLFVLFLPRLGHWRWYLLAVLVGYGSYVVYTGGDPLPGFRFALIVWLMTWLAVLAVVRHWKGMSTKGAALIVALLIANNVSQGLPGTSKGDVYLSFRNDKVGWCGRKVGRWLTQNAPAGATIATNTAGSIPYFAKNQIAIDMLGLTDAHIARAEAKIGKGWVGHERNDPKYVLSREPDYIFMCFSCNTTKPCLPGDKKLYRERKFRSNYRRQKVKFENFKFYYYGLRKPKR